MPFYYELISRNAAIAPKKTLMEYLVHHYAVKWKVYSAVDADPEREAVLELLKKAHEKVLFALYGKVAAKQLSYTEHLTELKSAPLSHKRAVAKSMAIIPTAAAATFIGMPETRLREMKDKALFGDQYLGRQCFSEDEMVLLALNPGWAERFAPRASTEEIVLPDSSYLDAMIFVDEDFAAAYTDMDVHEVLMQVTPTKRRYGTYGRHRQIRLSDLEKIRVAKLNASA